MTIQLGGIMHLLSLSGGLACLGLAGAAGYLAFAAPEPPRTVQAEPSSALIVESPVHDFGTVGQMETLGTEFRVVNHFPTAVVIKDLLKGCACSDSAISAERLEPGQAATLSVTWRTGGRHGKASEVVTILAVPEGDAGQQVGAQVRLTAQVEPDVRWEPAEVRFDRRQPGTVTVHFSPGRMPDVQIRSAHSAEPALRAAADPAASTVVVHYDPAKLSTDELTATVLVRTTSPKVPWVAVPVRLTGSR